jgi:hypothetical protein
MLAQAGSDRVFVIRCAYMEIYNEAITDLLSGSDAKLDIHETAAKVRSVGWCCSSYPSSHP